MKEKREQTARAVNDAGNAWASAPMHIRAMAGAYVGPLLAALFAMNEERQHAFDLAAKQARAMLTHTEGMGPELQKIANETASNFGEFRA